MRSKGFKKKRLNFLRRAVIASATVTRERNTIHSITEVDVSVPRRLFKESLDRTGEKVSLTAYIVHCLAQTLKDFPQLNSFIKNGSLILLDDVVISVLIERDIKGEKVPEPVSIQNAQNMTLKDIQLEIRKAQEHESDELGSLSGSSWIKWIPAMFLRFFVRIADKNIAMAKRYGKIGVTAMGMFTDEGMWFVPHGSPTLLLTVGSIMKKVIEEEGEFQSREHLCLTISLDHDIVDGAPAVRFVTQLLKTIKTGELLKVLVR